MFGQYINNLLMERDLSPSNGQGSHRMILKLLETSPNDPQWHLLILSVDVVECGQVENEITEYFLDSLTNWLIVLVSDGYMNACSAVKTSAIFPSFYQQKQRRSPREFLRASILGLASCNLFALRSYHYQ